MSTTEPRLVVSDVGNATIKYRLTGSDTWKIEPALVRAPAAGGYDIKQGAQKAAARAARPLVYVSGPARIDPAPWLVGDDAAKYGNQHKELSIVGAADVRVQSPAYLLLHFYSILASLPEDCNEAWIMFGGGLPARDMEGGQTERELKARLKGDHSLMWGDRNIKLHIVKAMIVPQQVAAVATRLFTPTGAIVPNGALTRKRLVLVVGGGTSDWTGRVGLSLVPGTEGGANVGLITAAAATVRMVRRAHGARSLTDGRVLDMLRTNEKTIHVRGAQIDITEQIKSGLSEAAQLIIVQVVPAWRDDLEESEVAIAGGGGQRMFTDFHAAFGQHTKLDANPLTTVAEGILRMALYNLRDR